MKPVIVLHGGAASKRYTSAQHAKIRASLETKLQTLYPLLEKGMSATEAVVEACRLLEDDPLYNAGFGSKIQSDGKIRMSASLMDGFERRFAGCVNVESIKNPIFLARALMKREDRVLSGEGAKRYARKIGMIFESNFTEERLSEWRSQKSGKSGTIGALALDRKGRLAAGTSTGGRGYEYPYRVSDSPTVAGNFANAFCAVSATGTGEQIVEQGTAATVCAYVEMGMSVDRAVAKVLNRARKAKAEFGMIALDKKGKYSASTTTPSIVWAAANDKGFKFFSK